MNRNEKWAVVLALVLFLALAGAVWAQTSPSHDLSWHVVGSGGADMASAGHAVRSTLGQFAIGSAGSLEHEVGSGYWYGARRLYRFYLPIVVKNY